MTCRKCQKEMPEGAVFCPWCGAKQVTTKRKRAKRANGQGSILKRGETYKAIVRMHAYDGTVISRSRSGFKTRRDAELAIPDLVQQLRRGDVLKESVKFAELYENWVPFYSSRVSAGEMKSAAAAFRHFQSIHNYRFADVTTAQMQSCIDSCPRGKRTKENMKLLARRMYAYAIGERIVAVNYADSLYCGNDPKGRRPPFTKNEIALIDQAERDGVPYADYVLAMIYTGFRPTEFLTLTRDSYDPVENIFIAGIKTEAGFDRVVPIHPRIQPIVDRALARGHILFPDENGRMMDDERFRVRYFEPLMERLGIIGRVPYSSRHSFANFLKRPEQEKLADRDIIALMGHSEKAQTIYYQTADLDELRAIINSFPVLVS
ncbi:MAG: tyrosine-type recombinase/integrase [Lachnospiraceae bacterium]|nr:tyrosine-type recombinase/integrase [Lachnospiraceae bacterium]